MKKYILKVKKKEIKKEKKVGIKFFKKFEKNACK